jgi:hypothetical protein
MKESWTVYYSPVLTKYITTNDETLKSIGSVYMSETNAYKLADLLNEGIIEL